MGSSCRWQLKLERRVSPSFYSAVGLSEKHTKYLVILFSIFYFLKFGQVAEGLRPTELLTPIVLNQLLAKAIQNSASRESEYAGNLAFGLKYLPHVFRPNGEGAAASSLTPNPSSLSSAPPHATIPDCPCSTDM